MNEKIMEAMEYMDEKYIGEVLDAGKKTSDRNNLMRWGAIAACLMLVVGLWMGMGGRVAGEPQNTEPQLNHSQPGEPDATAATAPHTEGIILPANRLGNNNMSMQFASITFQELLEEADAVAWVRVGNWLGERTGEMIWDTTFYAAEVIECYKGNLGSSIVLEQSGSSLYTLKGYPLFTYGNELLVFLYGGEHRPFREDGYVGVPFVNSYCVYGEYTTLMDVATTADGETYAIPRMDTLGDDIRAYIPNVVTPTLKIELCDILSQVDLVQQSSVEHAEYIFVMNDLAQLLESME